MLLGEPSDSSSWMPVKDVMGRVRGRLSSIAEGEIGIIPEHQKYPPFNTVVFPLQSCKVDCIMPCIPRTSECLLLDTCM